MRMIFDDSRCEWDDDKNQSNIEKHGVSFEEAEEVFYDINSIINTDIVHSHGEERFIVNRNQQKIAIAHRVLLRKTIHRKYSHNFCKNGHR